MYDYGSRGNVWENEAGDAVLHFVPRALWWGLEWSRYALQRAWALPIAEPPMLRGVNVQSLFDEQLLKLPKSLKKKLKVRLVTQTRASKCALHHVISPRSTTDPT